MAALVLSILLLGAPDAPATPSPGAGGPAPAALELPRAAPLGSLLAPSLLLAAAAGALLLARRRRRASRVVELVETTPLGGRRALVLARVGEECLLLGASEAGIALLRTFSAGSLAPAAPEPGDRASPSPPRTDAGLPRPSAARELPAGLAGLAARLRPSHPAPAATPRFDELLAESAEDQELRRKLARGERGTVR